MKTCLGLIIVLLAAVAAVADTQIASDTLERANCTSSCGSGGGLGSNWTQSSSNYISVYASDGASGGDGYSNQYRGVGYYSAASFTANQYAQVTNKNGMSDQDYIGISVRCSGSTSSNMNAYLGFVYYDESGTGNKYFKIAKLVNGTYTELASGTGASTAAGFVLYLSVSGSSLTLKQNGTQVLTATDSAVASGTAGIFLGTSEYENTWSGGNVSTSTPYTASASESLAASDSVARGSVKAASESLASSDSVAKAAAYHRVGSEPLTATDLVARGALRNLSEAVTFSASTSSPVVSVASILEQLNSADSLGASLNGAGPPARSITETLQALGSVVVIDTRQPHDQPDSLTSSDVLTVVDSRTHNGPPELVQVADTLAALVQHHNGNPNLPQVIWIQ